MSEKRTHFKSLVESDFLGQWDLPPGQDVVFIIERVEKFRVLQRRKVRDPRTGEMRDEKQRHIELTLRGQRKHFLANATNQAVIARLYGRFIEAWEGKAISLYVDPSVTFGREQTGGVRVRPEVPRKAPTNRPADNPVDPDKAAQLERARNQAEEHPGALAREPGED